MQEKEFTAINPDHLVVLTEVDPGVDPNTERQLQEEKKNNKQTDGETLNKHASRRPA